MGLLAVNPRFLGITYIFHHDSIACPVAALQKAKPFHSFHVDLLMRPYEPPTMYMFSVN